MPAGKGGGSVVPGDSILSMRPGRVLISLEYAQIALAIRYFIGFRGNLRIKRQQDSTSETNAVSLHGVWVSYRPILYRSMVSLDFSSYFSRAGEFPEVNQAGGIANGFPVY